MSETVVQYVASLNLEVVGISEREGEVQEVVGEGGYAASFDVVSGQEKDIYWMGAGV